MKRNRLSALPALLALGLLLAHPGAEAGTYVFPKGAKFVGKTEQGYKITIKTSKTKRQIRVFATVARTALCLDDGVPSTSEIVNVLPPLPIKVSRTGRFSIDAPNESQDYDPNYRIKGKVTRSKVTGYFVWRRFNPLSGESCVTKELDFTAKRR